jgi:acyl-coenzyme A synthetase/AMP-(fatty) acid ligase
VVCNQNGEIVVRNQKGEVVVSNQNGEMVISNQNGKIVISKQTIHRMYRNHDYFGKQFGSRYVEAAYDTNDMLIF